MTAPAASGFETSAALLDRAAGPADVFGPVTDDGGSAAARTFRRLARDLHPDLAPPGTGERAARLFARLAALYAAHTAAAAGGFGAGGFGAGGFGAGGFGAGGFGAGGLAVRTARARLRLGTAPLAVGDIAAVYPARVDPPDRRDRSGGVAGVWKLARDPRDNDLLAAEATALTTLARRGDPAFAAYVPRLLDTFTHREPGTGIERRGVVLERLDGFVSLADVVTAYPSGIDARDAAWIWRRLLVALGYAHRSGVVHGAVLPEHVLIEPVEHGVVLIDWCYSVPVFPPASLAALVTARAELYPPEVTARRPATPATDIHLAAGTMAALMGEQAPRRIRGFLAGCTSPDPGGRPQDAWALLEELDDLLAALYGPRRFRRFPWPPSRRPPARSGSRPTF